MQRIARETRSQSIDFLLRPPSRYTCRGLFEAHKLLFSFQMCVKILEAAQKINMDEYQFFLRGGIVSDRNDSESVLIAF